jgi:hypothetical protein
MKIGRGYWGRMGVRRQVTCGVVTPIAAGVFLAAMASAHAQTANNPPSPAPQPGQGSSQGQPASTSALYDQQEAAEDPNAPAWTITPTFGLDEIATDNVAETHDPQKDIESLASLDTVISADTPHLVGILDANGIYRHNINDQRLDKFTEYGYGIAKGNFFNDALLINLRGSIQDISSLNTGVQNPILQAPLDTHTYTVSASPSYYSQIDNVGFDLLRYQFGADWFSSNSTDQPHIPGFPASSLTASTDQSVQNDFKMAGTLVNRLMSDLSMDATENDSGNALAGKFQKANFELINEYEVSRWASVIGGAGYEWLHDLEVPTANGQGAAWDVGGRLKPNADSSILVTYGEHDRFADISGELSWQITPFLNTYAAYTDSLGNKQQSLIGSAASSQLSSDGAVSAVTYDQSTVIGTLNDAALSAGPGQAAPGDPLGSLLADENNFLPGENGLFRSKAFRANVQATIANNPFVLSAYHVQDISYTPAVTPSSTIEGANLSWYPTLPEDFSGMAMIGCVNTSSQDSNSFNGAVSLNWAPSSAFDIGLRYDYIQRATRSNALSFLQNSITLSLRSSLN